jgi:hypothetical protein
MTTMSRRATTRRATHDGRRAAVIHSSALAAPCYVTYWLITHVLSQVHSLSTEDDQLGGMWAVIAIGSVHRNSLSGASLPRCRKQRHH